MNKEKQHNKLVPELRFSEFEGDGDWNEKKLDEVCEVNPSNKNLPEEFVYIDLESVKSKKLLKKNIINRDGAPSRAQRLLKKEDVIFQMVRPYQKNNYFFKPEDNLEYVASTGYAQLRAFENKMYLFQYIHNDNFVNRVLDKCTGSNYPAINSGGLSKIKVEIPNPKEQQKIANCLSSLDNVITAETEKLDHLKDHKKGLLQQLFPAKGETKPQFRFPEFVGDGDWEEKTLGSIADIITGTTPKTAEPKYYDGQKLFASPADISENRYLDKTNKRLSQLGFSKSRVIPENSILFVCIGSTIGKIAQNRIECATNQQINSLIPFENHSNDFIYSLLENNSSRIASLAGHQAVPLINKTDFSEILISIPQSKLEQQKIANCLSSVDDLIEAQTTKIETLKAHKKGLMQQLFPNVNEE